jgi:transcriptional regulator with XRE-family HTH domain
MTVMSPARGVGGLLRDWRQRRHLSQLDLAVGAEVSARHLSFVETGRSKPSRELLLHLAEHLEVPLRERNSLLLAAGYAPSYAETPLEADELTPVRTAIETILSGHEPFPAVVVDRHWDLVSANSAAMGLIGSMVDASLLTPPVNALRISLHPDGLAPHILNLAQYSEHLLARLRRLGAVSADPDLLSLADELRRYPGVNDAPAAEQPSSQLFVPLVLQPPAGPRLTFFSTIATFGTALDITVAELAIESFFPADRSTAQSLLAQWDDDRAS